MREEIEIVLNELRQFLKSDGGDVELIDISEDGIVKVKLQGACSTCKMSQITLKNGIERILKDIIPDIKEVIAVEG